MTFPLTYEQTTLAAHACERRALDADEFADKLIREQSSDHDREHNASLCQRAALQRKRAAELRATADALWTLRRTLPDAPMSAPLGA